MCVCVCPSTAERLLQKPTQGKGGYKDYKGAHPSQ